MTAGKLSLPAMADATTSLTEEITPLITQRNPKRHKRERLPAKRTLPPGPFSNNAPRKGRDRGFILYQPDGKGRGQASRNVLWERELICRSGTIRPPEPPQGALRFPLLGPTRQESRMYFKNKPNTETERTEEEIASSELPIPDLKFFPSTSSGNRLQSAFDDSQDLTTLSEVFDTSPCDKLPALGDTRTRHNTLTDLKDLRTGRLTERGFHKKPQIISRFSSLPNVHSSCKEIPKRSGPMYNSDVAICKNERELGKQKGHVMTPSKYGFHPRSHSPTYKFLNQVRLKLEQVIDNLTEIMLARRVLDPTLEFNEFIDKHMRSELGLTDIEGTDNTDLDFVTGDAFICRSLERKRHQACPKKLGRGKSIRVPRGRFGPKTGDNNNEGLLCLSMRQPTLSLKLNIDIATLRERFHKFEPTEDDASGDSSSSMTRHLYVHLPILHDAVSEDSSTIKAEKYMEADDTRSKEGESESDRHTPQLNVSSNKDNDVNQPVTVKKSRDRRNVRPPGPAMAIRRQKGNVGLEYDSSDHTELDDVKQRVNEMEHRLRAKKKRTRKQAKERSSKTYKIIQPLKATDEEVDYELLRYKQEEENSRSLIQDEVDKQQEQGTDEDPGSDNSDRGTSQRHAINSSKLQFNTIKSPPVTSLAKQSRQSAEKAKDPSYESDGLPE